MTPKIFLDIPNAKVTIWRNMTETRRIPALSVSDLLLGGGRGFVQVLSPEECIGHDYYVAKDGRGMHTMARVSVREGIFTLHSLRRYPMQRRSPKKREDFS